VAAKFVACACRYEIDYDYPKTKQHNSYKGAVVGVSIVFFMLKAEQKLTQGAKVGHAGSYTGALSS
jgi:hypothetical protein